MNTAVNEAPDLLAALRTHGSLVRSIAHRIRARAPGNVEFGDLMQAGQIGLNEAMQRFYGRRSCSFGTYASGRIEGAMLEMLRADDSVSRRTRSRLRQVKQAVQKLEHGWVARRGRGKGTLERASIRPKVQVRLPSRSAGCSAPSMPSWDRLVQVGYAPGTCAAPPSQTRPPILAFAAVARGLLGPSPTHGLATRHRQVLELIYDADRSITGIGLELGLRESRVCQIHSNAVRQLQCRL